MEHIQRAIEKARIEREGAIGHNPFNEGENNTASINTKNKNHGLVKAPVDVHYSTTRRVDISDTELKARNIFAGFAHDPRSEPYRQLRSQVLKKMRTEGWQTLAITSPTTGNGKTLTALNLAISLSQEVNQTVLLVDLDLRNPGVASALGVDVENGIVDSMMNNVPLEDILINPGYNRLVIAPGTAQGHQTSEILSSPQMQTMQAELKGRYADRLIIYDLPALLTSDDALVFAPRADAVLLVLEDGGASESELKQAIKLLQGTNILGTIINKNH